MALRPARVEDASSIAALSIEVWIGTYLKQGVSEFFADYVLDSFTAQNIRALIEDPKQTLFVSDNAIGIDGFIRIAQDSPAPVAGCALVEIATFYVQPRHHGKGIGTALLHAGLAHARALNAPSVWLTTNAENTPAIAYYHAQGFTQIGETHFTIADQGYLNNVYRLML